jgi:UDP-2,3-diacylglucosamine hydrolase
MIAVIAGTGSLPAEACRQLLRKQERFFVITLFPENNAHELKQIVGDIVEVIPQTVFKPNVALEVMKQRLTTHVLLIGKVDKNHLLSKMTFDWMAAKFLTSLVYKGDKTIMEAVVTELMRHNLQVIKQDEILGGLLVKPGVLTGTLTDAVDRDITYGMNMALAIAHADIGQTVVVKDGMVLAVEAIEGTDACIKRGIELGGSNVVICKTARSDQNKKYDLPTLGPASLESFKPGMVAAIAWHSHCTLIAEQETFVKRASELGITLVSQLKS